VLNVLDIFSGIGGFSIGLEAVGMKTVAFCEINPFCRKILTRHWPSVPIFSDITTVHKKDLKTLPRIDIIAGGFPCQDISVAGKQKGIAAKREWHCIPASAFGAPHRRDRIWIIAHPTCLCKVGLSIGKEETESTFGDGCKNVSNSNGKRLQRHRRFKETSLICTQEQVSMYRRSRGIKQWGKEPLEAPRLKDERLNPDWVEWLMGYPISWTNGGSRMQRLMVLVIVLYL